MTLGELLSIFPQIRWGTGLHLAKIEVSGLVMDSRKIQPRSVFVACKGEKFDGHDYIPAVTKDALALIVEQESRLPKDYAGVCVVVPSGRDVLAQLAAKFYGEPARKLFSVAVTGTNGKTSTTYIIEHMLNGFGWPTGVIGTVDHHLLEDVWQTSMTSPDAISFQARLADFLERGARAVAFEASSHALDQHRVDECEADVAIFTNLTRDHLDYHGDMEHYYRAKARLFADLLEKSNKPRKTAIINGDDQYGLRLLQESRVRFWNYGQNERADLRIELLKSGYDGSIFRLCTPTGKQDFTLPMIGLHNVYNATGAIGAGLVAGISLATLNETLSHFAGVPGRMQRVPTKAGGLIYIDYAHTDDGIKTALSQLDHIRKAEKSNVKLIIVFGCGGDRDRGKRPLMMQAARSLADFVVVTSDNPRTEDPDCIINEIVANVPQSEINNKIWTQVDRRKAIAHALQLAGPQDVVLIAGKGHEKYQQIGKIQHPFDDLLVAKELADGI